jgi:hypothetical protein
MNFQERKDALRREVLANHPASRREALINFILGCATMARDLNTANSPFYAEHSAEVADYIAHLENAILEEFQRQFGRPLFPKEETDAH